jgi:hypothetical protein
MNSGYVPPRSLGFGATPGIRFPAAPVESGRVSPPHRPREYGLAYPAGASRSNLAAALGLLPRWRLSNPYLLVVATGPSKRCLRTEPHAAHVVWDTQSMMEETDLRIAETKKDTYEFKRDIVVGAENFRTGKTVAEKMLRYMESVAYSKDAMIEKLRLKNVTLKSQIAKMEQQLQQKEEMGEVGVHVFAVLTLPPNVLACAVALSS